MGQLQNVENRSKSPPVTRARASKRAATVASTKTPPSTKRNTRKRTSTRNLAKENEDTDDEQTDKEEEQVVSATITMKKKEKKETVHEKTVSSTDDEEKDEKARRVLQSHYIQLFAIGALCVAMPAFVMDKAELTTTYKSEGFKIGVQMTGLCILSISMQFIAASHQTTPFIARRHSLQYGMFFWMSIVYFAIQHGQTMFMNTHYTSIVVIFSLLNLGSSLWACYF